MAEQALTTIQLAVTSHQKLKVLAALTGDTVRDTIDKVVDSELRGRGLDPDTLRAFHD